MKSLAPVVVFFALVVAAYANPLVGIGLGHVGLANYAVARPALLTVAKPSLYAESSQILTPGNTVVSGSFSGPTGLGLVSRSVGLVGKPIGLVSKPIGLVGVGLNGWNTLGLGGLATKL